jgi:hypothetical protein
LVSTFEPGEAPDVSRLALKAWNLMSGIEWAALPIIAEIYGIEDFELFLRYLAAIRDHQSKRSEQG